ncbi:class I SAM-dependent methyltransferase [Streptomyces sp. NPDC094437]|uniref:class I SAM-dependent methyltransferase n=1 Tax=Streptomyces sp. NPDC094437 TaxID=3366060 RepID=UPI00382290CA
MEWGTLPGSGPGAAALGRNLRGLRLLELGCGHGHNAAHLAGAHKARVMAIDTVDLQIHRARDWYGHIPGTTFLTCDALRYLGRQGELFDVVYSVFGAIGLVDPDRLLSAIARRLRPRGRLVFSVPHPHRAAHSRVDDARPIWDVLRLPDGTQRPYMRWALGLPEWKDVLIRSGLRPVETRELGDPRSTRATTLMISARRPSSPSHTPPR